jgi:hypothetical protein
VEIELMKGDFQKKNKAVGMSESNNSMPIIRETPQSFATEAAVLKQGIGCCTPGG